MSREVQEVRQSRAEKLLKKEAGSLRRPTLLISAIVYTLLVFVVIYGAGDHVYDGFGKLAPWIVGGIFAVMAAIRFSEFLSSINAYKSVIEFLENRGVLAGEAAGLEDQSDEGQPDYGAFDEVNGKQ